MVKHLEGDDIMLRVQSFQELSGIEYVKADIACKFDKTFEKKSWNERIEMFDQIDINNPSIFKNASNPVGLRAAVSAYKKNLKGQPTGFMISQDASSSGLQLLSLLVSCPKSFRICGGDSRILDAYTHLYKKMGLTNKLSRAEVKDSIMTAFYGSTARPRDVFGEDLNTFYNTLEAECPGAWTLNLDIQELWDMVDGATYDWTLPDGFYANIETTDKIKIPFTFLDEPYEVIQEVNQRPKFHKGLGPNLIHSVDGMIVREMYRRCMHNPVSVYGRVVPLITNDDLKGGTSGKSAQKLAELWDLYEESGFLSARILDYIYEDTLGLVKDRLAVAKLIQSLPEAPFDLVTVHDCFRSHPNYGNDVRRQYNTILADINDSQLMQFIARQVIKEPHLVYQKGLPISRDVILNANYCLS